MENIIAQSAALRGQRSFVEAIALVETNIDKFDPDMRINGLMEIFYAAVEGGYPDKARAVAKEIAKEEPELPSIQRYL